jgi:hypothetical protein
MPIIINGTGTISGVSSTGLTTAQTVTQSAIATGVAGTGPAFNAYASGVQSIPSATPTKVVFDTEAFDTNNNFASSRFTPTVAGYYSLQTLVSLVNSAARSTIVTLFKNGAEIMRGSRLETTGFSGTNGAFLVYMNGTTDYVEIYMFQNSGSSLVTEYGQLSTYFSGFLARAA